MRESQTKKIPITLIIGDNEVKENVVSYREYSKTETITCTIDEFIKKLKERIKDKKYNI